MVEAFPIEKADTARVIKALLKEIIPKYGIQESESEEGQVSQQEQSIDYIKGQELKRLQTLITLKHLDKQKAIKERTAKICTYIGLKWPGTLNLTSWEF